MKRNIKVTHIGENSGHPITETPVPVRSVWFQDKIPYTVTDNAIIESTVEKDGTNIQKLRKLNRDESLQLDIKNYDGNQPSPQDSILRKYNGPHAMFAYSRVKRGTPEWNEGIKKFKKAEIPLATYGEAYDNLEEVERQTQHLQPGGSIASRLWNKWTGKDTYTDGYGTTRSHVPVKESAHRTVLKAADSPLVQAIPVVGDVADGYVAADYAAKGDYKPAMAAIGAGLILPNAMEVGARMIPSSTYRNIANKVDNAIEIVDVEDNLGKKYVRKNGEWVPENTGEIQVLGVEKPSRWNRTSDQRFNAVEDNSNRWIPETQYDDDLNVIAGSLDDSMSSEPWWGWDPVEYQKGGEIPSNDQQQQLFVSIITDMANVLGVEPSQELAEAVMTAFENNDDSEGLITLFTQIKDKRMSETGLFREGGKMNAFVSKFKCGGKAKKKTSKKQEGGEVELTTNYDYTNGPDLTRRQARKIAEVNKGADRADFRKGMQNARRHFDDRGLRGADKRNAARRLVAGLETANRTFTPPVAPAPELNVQLPVIETPAELQLKAREVVEPTPTPVTPNTPTAPTKPTTPTKPVASTPVTITGSPTVGGNYYDPNTNPWYRLGAKWGERARARREERRKNGERSFLQQLWDPHPEPLPTHDRKAAASGMVDDFLNTHSPRAKARK